MVLRVSEEPEHAVWHVGEDNSVLSHEPSVLSLDRRLPSPAFIACQLSSDVQIFDIYIHVRDSSMFKSPSTYTSMLESSYSQAPDSQLMCLSALEHEYVISMFALSLVRTLVTNILMASVQRTTPCAALLCCAQTHRGYCRM